MAWLAKWLSVPIAVIAFAIWLAVKNWLDSGWLMVGYGVVAFLILLIWRRATYRLVPSLWYAKTEDLDPVLKKKVARIGASTMIGSLIVSTTALSTMLLWRESWDESGLGIAFVIIAVVSFSKFGVMNLLVRQLLDRESAKGNGHVSIC